MSPSPRASLNPADTRAMYARVLASWTQDLLLLRRWGMDRPGRARPGAQAALLREVGGVTMGGELMWPRERAA